MSRADGILHLILHGQPYDDIARGFKPVEYRTRTNWEERILGKLVPMPFGSTARRPTSAPYITVRFQRGFHKDKATGRVPTMEFAIERVDIGLADPRWTYGIVPQGEEFVRIWIGARIR